jgi:hypothetical protein
MRTSVNLDEDAHQFASVYAGAKGITLSAAINELIRKAEAMPRPAPEIGRSPNGVPCFPSRGAIITTEMVKKIENELD